MEKQPRKAGRGQGRVAFLALAEEFRKLLSEGHPLISIYNDHKQQLGIGYPHFTRYIQRYIKKEKINEHQKENSQTVNAGNAITPAVREPSAPKPERKPHEKIPGFKHDPNSANTRDDLI